MVDNPGAISEAGVTTFLQERLGSAVEDVVPIQRGEWSKAFFFRHDGRDYVVRFGAYLEDFAKDRFAARFGAPGLPVPRVVEIGEAFGGHYAISERLFGAYIDEVDEDQMRALLPSLFAALDAMQQADLSATTGYGAWGADGTAPFTTWQSFLLDVGLDRPTDRIAGWHERLVSSPSGAGSFDEAYSRLQALVEYAPAERHLIHSDLLHFNVLVVEDRITGIFDWGCGLFGDFLYDLAWFCFWAPWYTAWNAIDFRQEALRHYAAIDLDVPHFEERLLACQLHIALGGQAYQAYKGYWPELAWTVRRTLAVLRGVS
jgi:hygromycin-B 4-O-kinase